MKIKMPVLRIAMAVSIGLAAGALLEWLTYQTRYPILLITCLSIGVAAALVFEALSYRRSATQDIDRKAGLDLEHLPAGAVKFIKLIIKNMRYRKKVRADVMTELAAHFEDALKDAQTQQDRQERAKRLIDEFGDVRLLAVLLRRAKKRCRPLWRTVVVRTFQTAGALILCFIAYCVYISLGRPTVSVNYLEEMTRLNRPIVDESLNAAPLYQEAIGAYDEPPRIEREYEYVQLVPGEDWTVRKEVKTTRTEQVDLLVAIRDKDWIGDLNRKELAALQQWISSSTQAIEFFRQAAKKPHCWWNWQAEDNIVLQIDFDRLAPIRNLTILMCWQAKLKAYDADLEAAFADLLTCYRAGSNLKGPRMLIEQLVAIAIQALATRTGFLILANQKMQHEQMEWFQDQTQKLLDQDTFVINYQTERFFALDFLQRCYTDDGKGSGRMIPGRVTEYMQVIDQYDPDGEVLAFGRSLAMSLAGADRDSMLREFDRFYATGEQWALKTPWQLRQENVDLEMGLDKWSRLKRARYWPVFALAPAMARIAELSYRCKTEIQTLIITLALLRFKQIHGLYPDALDQLLKTDLLETMPMDPYSDKPLVYRRIGDDFTLYSLGENFADDGAARYGDSWKWGDGRRKGDRVFWPVETRQQRQERYEEEREKERQWRRKGRRR
ncbi:MAG: hypothetical protein ACYTEL_02205 [Planctomycetota bacterium]|jgi:hypothetical protein